MIGAVVVESVSGNVRSTLSRGEREENVSAGAAVTCREIVGTAQQLVDFHQKLIRTVALLRRGNKVALWVVEIRRGE